MQKCGAVGNLEELVCLYCANITSYGSKAQTFLGSRLTADFKDVKAIIVCLQEIHRDQQFCDKEDEDLHISGWRSTWNPGRLREQAAGASPGSMIELRASTWTSPQKACAASSEMLWVLSGGIAKIALSSFVISTHSICSL